MEKLIGAVIIFLCSFTITLSSQSNIDISKELVYYGDVMVNTLEPSSRIRAGAQFKKYFELYLENAGEFTDTDFLKFTSHLDSPDGKFSLITWQVQKDSFQYDFVGYLIMDSGRIVRLNRTTELDSDLAYQTSTQDDWYGCIYYSMKKMEDNKYLLFGYDLTTQYDNQKLVDIITITNDDILFGDPIIEDKESLSTFVNRLIISYASDAVVNLNYNKGLDVIIQDHLEPRIGLQAGQGVTNIPDGTYEGYYLDKGKWMYREKLYDHVYKDAPRPKPVFISEKEIK